MNASPLTPPISIKGLPLYTNVNVPAEHFLRLWIAYSQVLQDCKSLSLSEEAAIFTFLDCFTSEVF